MKISLRIILITFIIVVLVSVSSAFIYYSISYSIIVSQNVKTLLNNSNDFVFEFEQTSAHMDEEFSELYDRISNGQQVLIDTLDIDFYFKLNHDNKIDPNSFHCKSFVLFNYQPIELEKFFEQNPGLILRYKYSGKNETYFYGQIIDEEFLADISKKILAEISAHYGNNFLGISNAQLQSAHKSFIIEAYEKLRLKNNFDVVNIESNNLNFFGVKYEIKNSVQNTSPITFIISSTSTDIREFANTIRTILFVTILTGILLSLIITVLFTSKFRKQLTSFVNVAQETSKGNLKLRVEHISNDEIGTLANNFNNMLDNISRKEELEKSYSEFVSIINRYAELNDLSKEALKIICNHIKMQFGVLYLFRDQLLHPIATEGIIKTTVNPFEENSVYASVINDLETREFSFKVNSPTLKTASLEFPIKYILLKPIIYNKKIVAVLELISEHVPANNPNQYLNIITEQLGIALNNAIYYDKLKSLVEELKTLNDNFQKQNEMISGQNKELTELHSQLKQKAEELNKERLKAVELSNTKSQFLANMSHELKTPLSSIIGLTEIILNDSSTIPANKNRLSIVFKNSKKLLEMINNILEFSKIDNNKTTINENTFLCSKVIDDIFNYFSYYQLSDKIKFKKIFKENSDYLIKTDKDKFEHILTNLLSNAFKFTESGFVELAISNKENDLYVQVSDSGIGMSSDDIIIIFTEFEQLNKNNKKYSGAGLGLAISKKYADLMNAKLTVESKIGIGSTFVLALPNVILDYLSLSIPLKDNLPITTNFIEGDSEIVKSSSPKILVVDDDTDILFTVGDILRSLGLTAVFAKNGIEGLAILAKENIELVLLDIMMPELDGFETIKHIRESDSTKDIKVIALTAYAMLDDKHIIEQSGFDDIITKPVDINSLKMKISQALLKAKKNEYD